MVFLVDFIEHHFDLFVEGLEFLCRIRSRCSVEARVQHPPLKVICALDDAPQGFRSLVPNKLEGHGGVLFFVVRCLSWTGSFDQVFVVDISWAQRCVVFLGQTRFLAFALGCAEFEMA